MVSKEEYMDYLKQWQSRMTDGIFQMLVAKNNLLPFISTISVAMLALLSLNEKLILNPALFKSSMFIFLAIIPVSLWFCFLEIDSALKSFVKSSPMSFDEVNNPDEATKRIKDGENLTSASKSFQTIFSNLKNGDFKDFRKNLWRTVLGLIHFVLIVALTVGFFLLILSLYYKEPPKTYYPINTPSLKRN